MTRRAAALVWVIVAVVSSVVACDRDGWQQTAPFAPSLRPAFGARVTDGQLRIWMGSPCENVTRLDFSFEPGDAELMLDAPDNAGVELEYLTFGELYRGLEVTTPLPKAFDWRKAQSMMLWLNAEPATWGSKTNIAEIINGSADHPTDTYWFQDVGWLNPSEVAAQNGKTFLATCTPDPAKTPSLPPAFGARVTDGTLRIWTGSPCEDTNGFTLTFGPSQAELALGSAGQATVELEHFTFDEPYPGLRVITPLPGGFDWRSQHTLTLSVHSLGPHEASQTDLTEVIKGSTEHPDDTYWFQDVGWLNPADVAAKDGKTFLATCTPSPPK